jgi:phospholipase/lecithinase/hemolysin
VVYGDSLSDNGNLFGLVGLPGAPYFNGRLSNGPVAVEDLAGALGVPLVDFALAGATTGVGAIPDGGTPTSLGAISLPGMQTQFAHTQGTLAPFLSNGLFVVWGGPNDFLNPSPLDATIQDQINRAVGDLVGLVLDLQGLGAQNILVPGMPDLGLTPQFQAQGAQYTALSAAFDTALQASLPAGVTYFDTFGFLHAVVANPAAYGLTNVTDPCFDGTNLCANPDEYLFWDGLHPTAAGHELIADGFETVVTPEPPALVLALSGLVLSLMIARRRTFSQPS